LEIAGLAAADAPKKEAPDPPKTLAVEDRYRFALLDQQRQTLQAQLATLEQQHRNLIADVCDKAEMRVSECDITPAGEVRKKTAPPNPEPAKPAPPEPKKP
jgi:hypothetical protein